MSEQRNGLNGTLRGIASSAVDTFKAQPMMLALILLNLVFIVGVFWYLRNDALARAELLKLILTSCLPRGT